MPSASATPRKSGRGEQVDVQGVALQPLAAVEDPPHRADPGRGLASEQPFEGLGGGELVRDRAEPADARDRVDHLVVAVAFQQALEQPWRLPEAAAAAR